MESVLIKRRKLLLLFLLGVGAPSLALSYLAFRGIRNELASEERRRVEEQRAASQFISDTLSREFAAAERAVARAVAEGDSTGRADFRTALGDLKRRLPLVEEVFLLDDGGEVRFPAGDLLYHPDGSLTAASARGWPAAAAALVQSARRLEFQQRDYAAAAAVYRQAFAAVSDPALRGEALVAVARVQRKARQWQAALASCGRLVGEYRQVRTPNGVPVAAVARLERGALLLAVGDSVSALRAFFDLYDGLANGEWALERAEYGFFAGQANDSISAVLARWGAPDAVGASRRRLADLRARETGRRERTERLLALATATAEHLRTRLGADAAGAAAAGPRFTLESAGQTFLVSFPVGDPGRTGVWGVLFDGNAVAGVLRSTLEDRLDPAASDWVVKGRDGSTLFRRGESPTGPVTINATFASNFPPWLLEFHERPRSSYQRLFASSQSIYFVMFLLIATILVFGFVLTIRAVSHELELARLKSDFVSTVSHEFRSPLTSIRHLAEMLQAGSVPSEERRRTYYDVLVEQSARLSSLVTNILDLARLEEGKKEFSFERLDLGALVRDLVTGTQQRVGHEGCIVEAEIGEGLRPILADRSAIAQAITNLVDNAIQYSRDVKEVRVRTFPDAGWTVVAVEDRGVGIPASEIDRVFERFYRGGDALTRTVKGSGLGLALVKEIVVAHGGTVHVESEVGRGSAFSIRLPAMTERDHVEDTGH